MSQSAEESPKRGRPKQAAELSETRLALLAAAETCLQQYGYSGLSTRRVADAAGLPLSQIHYHFGSKQGLVLALLDYQNRRLLARQAATFAQKLPLWQRWEMACGYLDEDLASGYVRVLQETMAAGWSDPEIAAAVRDVLQGWFDLITGLAAEADERFGGLGPFRPAEAAALIGNIFLGSESMLLLGFDEAGMPIRGALRKLGDLIRRLEEDSERGG